MASPEENNQSSNFDEDAQPKAKYRKDNQESVKRRNEARKEKPKVPGGNLSFSTETDEQKVELFSKIHRIKEHLGDGNPNKTTNYKLLNELCSHYIMHVISSPGQDDPPQEQEMTIDQPNESHDMHEKESGSQRSIFCDKDTAKEQLFLTTCGAINGLLSKIRNHSNICDQEMLINKDDMKMSGHVAMITASCPKSHSVSWISTDYLGQKSLGNLRIAHGYAVSGILPNQYERFCRAAGIGVLGEEYMNTIMKKLGYIGVVRDVMEKSCSDALEEEKGSYAEDYGGINVMTDARHGTRKNAKDTSVVCIGSNSHKVIQEVHLTKSDDPVTQRHERLGTEKLYSIMDAKGVKIKLHSHDRNQSVNKYVREQQKETLSNNDTWHAAKGVTKAMATITKGTKGNKGKTWHPELADKAGSIRTHIYWAMKNCEKDPEKLKNIILNIVNHYKDTHDHCHETSRCRSDPNYTPNKELIQSKAAEDLLVSALKKLEVFKNSKDYCYCVDTFFVESFNNAMLQYHDKRVVFSDENYEMRTNLAIIDWNEHVGREHTSTKSVMDVRNPRRTVQLPVRKRKAYQFWDVLWPSFVDVMLK